MGVGCFFFKLGLNISNVHDDDSLVFYVHFNISLVTLIQ